MRKQALVAAALLLLIAVSFPVTAHAVEGGYFYTGQIASLRSGSQAARLVKTMKEQGREAFYQKFRSRNKGLYFRVLLGKYENRADAVKSLERLKKDGTIKEFVVIKVKRADLLGIKQEKAKLPGKKSGQAAIPAAKVDGSPKGKQVTSAGESGVPGSLEKGADYYYILGIASDEKNQFDRAIEYYSQAIEKNPKFASAFNKRGVLYLKTGRSELAIADHNKAVSLDPMNAEYYFNRGIDYRLAGDFNLAAADFMKSCQMGNGQACDALKRLKEKAPVPSRQ